MTSQPGDVQITRVDADVERAAIVARFALGGRTVDPQWQGAFGRALEGHLDGIAGRWQLDARGISVSQVEPASAARVAAVVAEAVSAANAYVAATRDAARAEREEWSRVDAKLRIELETAQAAMRAELGLTEATSGDHAAVARFDDESPALSLVHEPAEPGPER